MEVFLAGEHYQVIISGLLHARGGVSGSMLSTIEAKRSSPRSWRCFRFLSALETAGGVFSTLVEVFLTDQSHKKALAGLLHARGGVSQDYPYLDREN